MKNEEYVNYTLKNLEESVREALESEATPKEVYDAIINEIERTANYHRACLNTSAKTLSLFEDNIEVKDTYTVPDNVISFNSVERKITEAKNASEWNNFFVKDSEMTTDPVTWPDYTELPGLDKDITINTTDTNKKDA